MDVSCSELVWLLVTDDVDGAMLIAAFVSNVLELSLFNLECVLKFRLLDVVLSVLSFVEVRPEPSNWRKGFPVNV